MLARCQHLYFLTLQNLIKFLDILSEFKEITNTNIVLNIMTDKITKFMKIITEIKIRNVNFILTRYLHV